MVRVSIAVLSLVALAGCRPVVRACSVEDACRVGASCVGGRCEKTGAPIAIADAERVVLTPLQSAWVDGFLFLAFDPEAARADAIEAHLVLRKPPGAGLARLYRVVGSWNERSTKASPAWRAAVGARESEARFVPEGASLIRLPISADSRASQRKLGWAVRFEPRAAPAVGAGFAESAMASETGPRLELYLPKPPLSPAHSRPPR